MKIEAVQGYIDEGNSHYKLTKNLIEENPEKRKIQIDNIKHRLSMWNSAKVITDLEMDVGDCIEDYVSDVQLLLYLLGELDD